MGWRQGNPYNQPKGERSDPKNAVDYWRWEAEHARELAKASAQLRESWYLGLERAFAVLEAIQPLDGKWSTVVLTSKTPEAALAKAELITKEREDAD